MSVNYDPYEEPICDAGEDGPQYPVVNLVLAEVAPQHYGGEFGHLCRIHGSEEIVAAMIRKIASKPGGHTRVEPNYIGKCLERAQAEGYAELSSFMPKKPNPEEPKGRPARSSEELMALTGPVIRANAVKARAILNDLKRRLHQEGY